MRSLRVVLVFAMGLLFGAFHSPHDVLTAWVLSPNFAEDHTLFVAASRFKVLLRSTDGGLSFEPVNVGLSTGNIGALAISLNFAEDRTLWALEGDRLLRSTDAGDHWVKQSMPEKLRGPRALSIAADGRLLVGSAFTGLWRFDPSAGSWTQLEIAGAAAPPIIELASNPARTRFLGMSTNGRAFLSDQSGARFNMLRLPVNSLVTAAVFVDGERPALFLGTQGHGVFRSADGGKRWARVNEGLDDLFVTDLAATTDEQGAAVLFASTETDGVFRGELGGAWTRHARGLRKQTPQTDVHYSGVVPAPDFAESGLLYLFGFEGLHVSRRGQAWTSLHTLPGSLVRNLALSPHFADDKSFWLSTYGRGLLSTSDAGASFARLDSGHFDFPDAIGASREGSVAIGRPGSLAFTRDAGASWDERLPGERGFPRVIHFAPDYASSGVMLASVSLSGAGTGAGIFRSADHGESWERVGPKKAYRIAYSPSWERSGRVWLASPTGLYSSDDRGVTWTRSASCPEMHVRDVAVRPLGEREELLITGVAVDRVPVHVSRDAGETWELSTDGLEGTLPIYAGFGADTHAFIATHDQGVFRRVGDANTWAPAGKGPRTSFAFEVSSDFERDQALLAGTYEGAWISEDAGDTWRLSVPQTDD